MPPKPSPQVIWLTGYSGAGKSTIATLLRDKLHENGRPTALLDGDAIRLGLNSDLDFSDADRAENIRRVSEVARLMVDAGMVAVVALISPFRQDRDRARAKFAPGEFVEVFVDTPLAVAEARDVKGLYRRARAGLLPQFTGIDSAYEVPINPEIRIDTLRFSAEVAARQIAQFCGDSSA
ncbi:MAG: adenylyl-sulfate kinase [Rhizobacter sp.]|nr:adenylyl-sulfate kinase [Burkholderiales bacterium]